MSGNGENFVARILKNFLRSSRDQLKFIFGDMGRVRLSFRARPVAVAIRLTMYNLIGDWTSILFFFLWKRLLMQMHYHMFAFGGDFPLF